MKDYGTGKAGQHCKAEADKRFRSITLRILTVMAVGGICIGIGLGFYAFPLVFRFLPWARRVPAIVYSAGVLALEIVAGVIVASLIRAVRDPLDKLSHERIRYLYAGQAEALVAYTLRSLDDKWHLFNGIAMKGGGDIDHVLVGPRGLFCLSTKSSRGIYSRGTDGRVMLNGKPNDDVAEAQRLAMTLRHWLEARLQPDHGVRSIPFVQPVLVVPFAFIDFEWSAMNVWVVEPNKLIDVANNAKSILRAATIDGCVKVLKDLTGWQEHRRPNEWSDQNGRVSSGSGSSSGSDRPSR